MTSRTPWQLLIDPPAAGTWNMAVDEVLLDWAAAAGGCALRLYRWSEPTLSLGYFQAYRGRYQHASSRTCAAVRRLTGGGAILHDQEWTYSLVVPAGHRRAGQRDRLYEAVHGSLIEALAGFGISAELCPRPGAMRPDEEPFLCFHRRAPGDVVVAGEKIAGSAQRRRRGAILQHGSVLLRRSAAAPEFAGLEDLSPGRMTAEDLRDRWLETLAASLAATWRVDVLTAQQRQLAAELSATRYAAARWTEDRGR